MDLVAAEMWDGERAAGYSTARVGHGGGLRERVELVLYHAYRLALMLGLLAVVLTPLHRASTHSADVVRVEGDTIEAAGAPTGLQVGDRLPVYRFHSGWTRPIGAAEVTELREDGFSAVARGTYEWPLGMQGRVDASDGGRVELNIGSEQGVAERATLHVFEARHKVGALRVGQATADSAVARRTRGSAPAGATVSGYTVANQLSWFHAPGVAALEWGALLTVLSLWAWGIFSPTPGRALLTLREGLIAGWRRGGAPLRILVHAALGVVLVPLVVQLTWGALVHVGRELFDLQPLLKPWTDSAQRVGYAVLGTAWAAVLFKTTRSPAVAAWRAATFRPRVEHWPPWLRGGVIWALHLAVAYAFASTLTGFLAGNVNGILTSAWDAPGLVRTARDLPTGLGHMLTHAPSVSSWDEAFAIARLALWSATISGCLVGYGHTVVSILWKRVPVRNIDFTPVAWIVNAMCYGPLLGGVVYRMHGAPPVVVDPSLTAGPAWALQLVAELLLNLLYTLSIWNLGTRFGVMVDKGVQTRGFYSFVRHPSYTLEALMFVTLGLTGYATPMHYAIALVWPVKYFLRSERDDQFMGASNPDYVAYREKVRWRYIPNLL